MKNKCVFCVEHFENGYPLSVIPKTFTAQQWLQAGSGVCERCYTFLKTPEARRNSWIIKGEKMKWENAVLLDDPLSILLSPPAPPFRLYLTKQKRKHGWIRLIHNPALKRIKFPVAYEEDLFIVDVATIRHMHKIAASLMEKGASKKDLLYGFSAGKAIKLGVSPAEICAVQQFKGNRLWEVVVKFGRRC